MVPPVEEEKVPIVEEVKREISAEQFVRMSIN